MNTLLISYDLKSPEMSADYDILIQYIKSYGSWAKPLYSQWMVRTSKSVSQVRDELKTKVDANDRLFVVDMTGSNWASSNLPVEVTNWLKTNNPVVSRY